MANKIFFQKNQADNEMAVYRIVADGDSITNLLESSYKVITCTDDQFNNLKLGKKNVSYDSSDNLTFTDNTISFASEDELTEAINGLENLLSASDWKTQIATLKTKDFSGETFPCTKHIGELAEEKGMTWKSPFQFL